MRTVRFTGGVRPMQATSFAYRETPADSLGSAFRVARFETMSSLGFSSGWQ